MFSIDIILLQVLAFMLVLIIVNVILGVAIAIRGGTFRIEALPRFLQTEVLPYYLSLLALAGMAMMQDIQQYGTKPLAWAAIVAYGSRIVFVELKDKVVVLFGPIDTR